MKYVVKDQRTLIVYKKTLELYKSTINDGKVYNIINLTKLKRSIIKIIGYIARSTGDCLYPNRVMYDIEKAIKWTYKTEVYLEGRHNKEILEIRKILYGLKKKVEVI